MEGPLDLPADLRQLADCKRALDQAAIVATTDVTGRITSVNDKFCEISGYAREELLGQDHRLLNSGYHSKEFMRGLWTTIARGAVWHGEIRNRAKDGRYYWVDTTIVPFLDVAGKPCKYIAIRVDVTARKLAEEALAQQAVYARVAEMAATVAHEVRNALAGVRGAMQVLLAHHGADDVELFVIRDVIARVDASSELINDLLAFARPRQPQLGTVRLRSLVQDAIALVRQDLAALTTEIHLHGSEVTAAVDAELVRAATINLLRNAIQAMSNGGRIDVTVCRCGEMATVEVRDTGPGMPLEIRERVLEPFFTTKTRGGGLGLPIARRTADLHGGSLTLAFPTEGGTQVTLRLPLHAATAVER